MRKLGISLPPLGQDESLKTCWKGKVRMNRFAVIAASKISSFGRAAGFAVALITGLGLVGSAGGSAGAATILVDFGSNASFRGVSVPAPDVNGNYWNSIIPGAYIPNMFNTSN